jgi:hypothetical protein
LEETTTTAEQPTVGEEIQVHCAATGMVEVDQLWPHPSNPNTHPEQQLEMFEAILRYQGWRRPITVSKRSGFITKGHGALLTAKRMGLARVPVDFQEYPDEASELADLAADNLLPRLAELDTSKLGEIQLKLDALGVAGTLMAMTPVQLEALNTGAGDGSSAPPSEGGDEGVGGDGRYTGKIEAPIYEPQAEAPPPLDSLADSTKALALCREIHEAEGIPDDVKTFLSVAAQRHVVFNYERVAEFYAHAPANVQRLMERSALVIIDFDAAIEQGLVAMSTKVAEAYADAGNA